MDMTLAEYVVKLEQKIETLEAVCDCNDRAIEAYERIEKLQQDHIDYLENKILELIRENTILKKGLS